MEVDMGHAASTFKIEGWDEQPLPGFDGGAKVTQASVTQALSGDIEGEGHVEWLMCYRSDETADFVGIERISGRLGERSGSFVLLQTDGTFDGQAAKGTLSVVPGSGTGELQGLRGTGAFSAPRGGETSLTLEYGFE
jgi:hypothetical protein